MTDDAGQMYQLARLLIFGNLDGVEDFTQLVRLAPVFRVSELFVGFLRYKTTRAQVAPVSCQCPAIVAVSSVS